MHPYTVQPGPTRLRRLLTEAVHDALRQLQPRERGPRLMGDVEDCGTLVLVQYHQGYGWVYHVGVPRSSIASWPKLRLRDLTPRGRRLLSEAAHRWAVARTFETHKPVCALVR